MADMCDTCGDGVVELLRKILENDRDTFVRLGQIVASGGGGASGAVNLTALLGTATSVGCGTSDAGTLRVAQATDCNVQVVGNVASSIADSGNPVKMGFQARTTLPTAVTDSQRVNGISDKFGRQVVQHGLRELRGHQKTTITSSVAETTIVTAVALAMLDLYGLLIANTSTTACNVTIRDSTGGTIRFVVAVPAGETRGFMLPACDGHKQAAVNTAWTAQCGTSVASIEITALTVQNTA